MKFIYFSILFACLSLSLNAQTIEWVKNYGGSEVDRLQAAKQTADGGYILGGTSHSSDGDVSSHHGSSILEDFWVVKVDSDGAIEWEKNYGGTLADDLSVLQQTSDGGYIIGGYSESNDYDFDQHYGSTQFPDIWIVKTDSQGNMEWKRNYGGTSIDRLYSLEQTTDGGYILAGQTYSSDEDVSFNHGDYDAWVVKIDVQGNIEWERTYGGSHEDYFRFVKQTEDGGFIFGGASESSDGDLPGHYGTNSYKDFWLLKTDVEGNITWSNHYGGSANDYSSSLDCTYDGGYIMAGTTYSNNNDVTGNNGQHDFWVVKTDSDGNKVWMKTYGGSDNETCRHIRKTTDGGYVISGLSSSTNGDVGANYGANDFWVVRIDGLGEVMWEKNYGGSSAEEFSAFDVADDGGYIIGGETASENGDVPANYGIRDFLVLRISEDFVSSNHTALPAPETFDVSPNPNTGIMTITTQGLGNKTLKVFDSNGKLVKEHTFSEAYTNLDMQGKKGAFIIQILSQKSVSAKKVFIW